jgi:tRNA-splicing ligase RtcB
MDTAEWIRRSPCLWELPPSGAMRVPVRIHASEDLLTAMDEKVRRQAAHVAGLARKVARLEPRITVKG